MIEHSSLAFRLIYLDQTSEATYLEVHSNLRATTSGYVNVSTTPTQIRDAPS